MKLMKQAGLTCKVRIKKYKSYKGEQGKTAPNILQRNFKADKPNKKWSTDIMVNRYNRICVVWQKAVPVANYRPI